MSNPFFLLSTVTELRNIGTSRHYIIRFLFLTWRKILFTLSKDDISISVCAWKRTYNKKSVLNCFDIAIFTARVGPTSMRINWNWSHKKSMSMLKWHSAPDAKLKDAIIRVSCSLWIHGICCDKKSNRLRYIWICTWFIFWGCLEVYEINL